MKHNEITKELLSMDKNFFRNLHERFDFDFNDKIGFYRLDGKFTLNTIKGRVMSAGFSPLAKCIVLTAIKCNIEFQKSKGIGLYAFRPVMVNLNDNSFDTISVSGCNSYWRKADFNDMRKYADIVSYIIVQDGEDLKNRQKERNRADRRKSGEQRQAECRAYNLSRFRVFRVERDSEGGWIEDVAARDEKGHEVGLYHDYNWDERPHIADLNGIVDGSGYVVRNHKEDLMRRLDAYKAMKKNKAYAQTDNSDKVTMVNALVSARKTILDAQFKSVRTSEEVNEFISKLYRFRIVMEDVERFCKRTAEKTFASIEQSERDYQYLLKELTA